MKPDFQLKTMVFGCPAPGIAACSDFGIFFMPKSAPRQILWHFSAKTHEF
jgi:hypothetical protein